MTICLGKSCSFSLPCMSFMKLCKFTLKAPITTAADDIHKYFFNVFQQKIMLDVSSESSERLKVQN